MAIDSPRKAFSKRYGSRSQPKEITVREDAPRICVILFWRRLARLVTDIRCPQFELIFGLAATVVKKIRPWPGCPLLTRRWMQRIGGLPSVPRAFARLPTLPDFLMLPFAASRNSQVLRSE
jgi:hypothetical protein